MNDSNNILVCGAECWYTNTCNSSSEKWYLWGNTVPWQVGNGNIDIQVFPSAPNSVLNEYNDHDGYMMRFKVLFKVISSLVTLSAINFVQSKAFRWAGTL